MWWILVLTGILGEGVVLSMGWTTCKLWDFMKVFYGISQEIASSIICGLLGAGFRNDQIWPIFSVVFLWIRIMSLLIQNSETHKRTRSYRMVDVVLWTTPSMHFRLMTPAKKLVGRDPVPEITIDTGLRANWAITVGVMGTIVDSIQSNPCIGADESVNGGIPTAIQTLWKNRRFGEIPTPPAHSPTCSFTSVEV